MVGPASSTDLNMKLYCACFEAAEAILCRQNRSPFNDEHAMLLARASVHYAARGPKQDQRMLASACWLPSRVAGDLGDVATCEGFARTCSIYTTELSRPFKAMPAMRSRDRRDYVAKARRPLLCASADCPSRNPSARQWVAAIASSTSYLI
jgi:hypothetical protein